MLPTWSNDLSRDTPIGKPRSVTRSGVGYSPLNDTVNTNNDVITVTGRRGTRHSKPPMPKVIMDVETVFDPDASESNNSDIDYEAEDADSDGNCAVVDGDRPYCLRLSSNYPPHYPPFIPPITLRLCPRCPPINLSPVIPSVSPHYPSHYMYP